MKTFDLNNFTRGWLCGRFEPTLFDTAECEVGIKKYKKDEYETSHFHLGSTEYTVILSGTVLMNGVEYTSDDIIAIEPGEATDFYCKTDVITVVIRDKSVKNDKFLVDQDTTFIVCSKCNNIKVSDFCENDVCKNCK